MSANPPPDAEKLAEGTLVSHLLELRDRLLRAVVVVILVSLPLLWFSQQLFTFIAHPLIEKLPAPTNGTAPRWP